MLYNYIFVYKSISFKNCKIVSPATFVNKLDKQSESRLDNGVVSINLSRTCFTGIGHVLEYINQVLNIHSF